MSALTSCRYFKQNELMNYLVSVPYSKVKAGEVV